MKKKKLSEFFDVAVLCWLLAHDPDELKFWNEIDFEILFKAAFFSKIPIVFSA